VEQSRVFGNLVRVEWVYESTPNVMLRVTIYGNKTMLKELRFIPTDSMKSFTAKIDVLTLKGELAVLFYEQGSQEQGVLVAQSMEWNVLEYSPGSFIGDIGTF